MKPWAQVEASPEFLAAPDPVKQEVRAFYKADLVVRPEFQGLPPAEQKGLLQVVDGDGEYPIKLAAALIVAARQEKMGRAVLDPKADEALDNLLKGAKAADKYLDVPLKDRPREPFQDEIPGHLDKPLRAVLGFIDDALPEYSAVKFWNVRRAEPLEEKLRNVLALSARQPERPVDANAALNLPGFIRDYPALDRRLPTALPAFRTWSPEAQEHALAQDPEAALKHGLPQVQWGPVDRAVITNLVHVLAGVKQGVPRAFRPDAVPAIAAEVKRLSYEMLARQLYKTPSPNGRVPTDPDRVAEIILAAAALAPGMDQVADDFPSVFAVAAGLAAVPKAAVGRYRTFLNEVKTPLTTDVLLRAVASGSMSFIKLSTLDEMLFQTAATAAGARPDALPHLVRDVNTGTAQPLLAALLLRSEALDRRAFEQKKAEVRQQVQQEAQRQTAAPPAPLISPAAPAVEEPAAPPPNDGTRAAAVPEGMPLLPPDEPAAAEETPAPESRREAVPAAQAAAGGALTAYLRVHPISAASVKQASLAREFSGFPDAVAAAGVSLDETVAALQAAQMLPAGADYNDLLDALEADHRGGGTPPPGAEAGAHLPPTDPSASTLPGDELPTAAAAEAAPLEDQPAKKGVPSFTVQVVEVDPATIIPRKTAAEIEPARIRGVQQRFPEGRGYPAVTVYEAVDGLHLIDGHHRTMVAKGRGDTIKAVVVSEADYKALEAAGLEHLEISYLMLQKAGQSDATTHLEQQYPDKNLADGAADEA